MAFATFNDTSDLISSLIDFVYPSILDNYNNNNYFSERAILAPKNEVVHEINDRLLALFPGEERLYNRVIETEIISGGNIGTCTYIPRLNLIPSDKKIPFAFQRRQFSIVVCFAMTINKS
ncbi:uncharacterized protein LOC118486575 [Helianthus annuus]|uniref:uncharacterized protein LOC118486575 n=1 Tax=Helianthus annuus TaxID=4232 RepID=UPI0016533DAC|nr:uncharacterized protein LOC118486575 [Helianthus annuus]